MTFFFVLFCLTLLYWNSSKLSMKWLISLCPTLVWKNFFCLFDAMVATIYSSQAYVPLLRQFEIDMNPLTADVLSLPYYTNRPYPYLRICKITVDSIPTICNYFCFHPISIFKSIDLSQNISYIPFVSAILFVNPLSYSPPCG